jgi:hypothetical protein
MPSIVYVKLKTEVQSKELSPERKNTDTDWTFFLLDALAVAYFPFHACMAENDLTEHSP